MATSRRAARSFPPHRRAEPARRRPLCAQRRAPTTSSSPAFSSGSRILATPAASGGHLSGGSKLRSRGPGLVSDPQLAVANRRRGWRLGRGRSARSCGMPIAAASPSSWSSRTSTFGLGLVDRGSSSSKVACLQRRCRRPRSGARRELVAWSVVVGEAGGDGEQPSAAASTRGGSAWLTGARMAATALRTDPGTLDPAHTTRSSRPFSDRCTRAAEADARKVGDASRSSEVTSTRPARGSVTRAARFTSWPITSSRSDRLASAHPPAWPAVRAPTRPTRAGEGRGLGFRERDQEVVTEMFAMCRRRLRMIDRPRAHGPQQRRRGLVPSLAVKA